MLFSVLPCFNAFPICFFFYHLFCFLFLPFIEGGLLSQFYYLIVNEKKKKNGAFVFNTILSKATHKFYLNLSGDIRAFMMGYVLGLCHQRQYGMKP